MNYPNPIEIAGRIERRAKAAEVVAVALKLVQAKGDLALAHELSKARNTSNVVAVLKAAIAAGSVSSTLPLAEFGSSVAAFFEGLANISAFDRLSSAMRLIPLHSRASVTTLAGSASTVGEGQISPVTALAFAGKTSDVVKVVSIVVVSDELARISDPDVFNLFARELRVSVALETDVRFLALISAGIAPVASNGGTSIAILQDIAGAAAAITTSSTSQLFIIVDATTAKAWATKTTSTGALAFPQMTPQGGQLAGFEVVVSDGTPAATFIMVDAAQLLASSGSLELEASSQADIIFDTSPSSPPSASAVSRSLFQHDLTALKITRYFSAARARDGAIAIVNNLSYSGNSPA